MPPSEEHKNKKFTADVREEYLEHLRNGSLKFESAEKCGVSYRTVERHMADDEDFKDEIRLASAQAREGVEKVLFGMALEGDLGAIKMWQTAHDRSTYGDKAVLQIDATQAAVEMTANQALAQVAELHKTLAEREARLLDTGDIIDAESEEVTDGPVGPDGPKEIPFLIEERDDPFTASDDFKI